MEKYPGWEQSAIPTKKVAVTLRDGFTQNLQGRAKSLCAWTHIYAQLCRTHEIC